MKIIARPLRKHRRDLVKRYVGFDNDGAIATENSGVATVFKLDGDGRLTTDNGRQIGSQSSNQYSRLTKFVNTPTGFGIWSFFSGIGQLQGAEGFCLESNSVYVAIDDENCTQPINLVQAGTYIDGFQKDQLTDKCFSALFPTTTPSSTTTSALFPVTTSSSTTTKMPSQKSTTTSDIPGPTAAFCQNAVFQDTRGGYDYYTCDNADVHNYDISLGSPSSYSDCQDLCNAANNCAGWTTPVGVGFQGCNFKLATVLGVQSPRSQYTVWFRIRSSTVTTTTRSITSTTTSASTTTSNSVPQLACLPISSPFTARNGERFVLDCGFQLYGPYLPGGDYNAAGPFSCPDLATCLEACSTTPGCMYASYQDRMLPPNPPLFPDPLHVRSCALLSSFTVSVVNPDFFTGYKMV